jgi:hypothetical protein
LNNQYELLHLKKEEKTIQVKVPRDKKKIFVKCRVLECRVYAVYVQRAEALGREERQAMKSVR